MDKFGVRLTIGVFTGARTGELLALKWSDIDFVKREIHIERSFTNKKETDCKTSASIRTIPMFDGAYRFFKQQLSLTYNCEYVFVNQYEKPFIDSNKIRKHWYPFIKSRGLENKVLYSTRHTFAVKLLGSGKFKPLDISQLMGHSSVKMLFEHYAKYIKLEKKYYPLDIE